MMEKKINNKEMMTMIHQIKHRINQNFQQIVELYQSLSDNMRLDSNAQKGVETYPSQQLHNNLNTISNVSALQHSPAAQVASNLAHTPSAGWPPSAWLGVQTTSNSRPTLNLPEVTAINEQYSRMCNLLHENMFDTHLHISQMIINLLRLIMDDLLLLFRTLSFSSSSNTNSPNNISNLLQHENKIDLELQQMMQITNNLLQRTLEEINKLLIPLRGTVAIDKLNDSYKYLNHNLGNNQLGQIDKNKAAIQPSVSIIQNPFAPNNNNIIDNFNNNDVRTLLLGSSSIFTQPTSPHGNTSPHQQSQIGVYKDENQIMMLPTSPPPINIISHHLLQPTSLTITEAQRKHCQNTQYTTRKMPCPLGIEQDTLRLSKFLCFIRSECIEIFHATREDVTGRMTSKKVQFGQVGIRCRFCAHLVPSCRANRSSSFPKKIEGIYQGVQMMIYKHFPICEEIPDKVRERYNSLKKLTKKGDVESRSYWIESAELKGMINSGAAGISIMS